MPLSRAFGTDQFARIVTSQRLPWTLNHSSWRSSCGIRGTAAMCVEEDMNATRSLREVRRAVAPGDRGHGAAGIPGGAAG